MVKNQEFYFLILIEKVVQLFQKYQQSLQGLYLLYVNSR